MLSTIEDVKRFPYTPVLGWSATRYDIFSSCKRQYFYHYYGKYDDETPKSKIDSLKTLRSIPMEIGTTVHDCLAELFKRLVKRPDIPVNRGKFLAYAGKQADIHAKERRYAEVHYKLVGRIAREDLEPAVVESLSNLLSSERYEWILNHAIRYRENWIIDPPGYGETRVNGMKAYSRVDFLIPGNPEITILEWKTGKEREDRHAIQLKGYASWALYHTGANLSDIVPVVAYLLPSYREVSHMLDDSGMEEFSKTVAEQTKELYAQCSDIQQNTPRPKVDFPLTDSLSTCRHCNFRELCKR